MRQVLPYFIKVHTFQVVTIASSLAPVEMDDMFEDAEETRVYETVNNLEGKISEF